MGPCTVPSAQTCPTRTPAPWRNRVTPGRRSDILSAPPMLAWPSKRQKTIDRLWFCTTKYYPLDGRCYGFSMVPGTILLPYTQTPDAAAPRARVRNGAATDGARETGKSSSNTLPSGLGSRTRRSRPGMTRKPWPPNAGTLACTILLPSHALSHRTLTPSGEPDMVAHKNFQLT
jgi:hypothetical protein